MAVTEVHTGSATITTTEYSLPNASTTLTPRTTAQALQCFIDATAVVDSDVFRVRVYEKATSGGTQRVIYVTDMDATTGVLVLPTLLLMHGWDVTIQRTAGTNRSISWSLRTP